MNNFRKIFFRAIFFYSLAFIFVYFAVDFKKVAAHSWPKTLSRLRLDYSYLISISDNKPADHAALMDGVRYFKAISRIFGSRPDTDAFLGMSFYYLSIPSLSKEYFFNLTKEAPGFFWGFYNLAILSYQAKDYPAMVQYAQQAFQSPIDKSLAFMMTSKVYQPLFIENHFTPQMLAENMERGKGLLLKLLLAAKSGASLQDEMVLPVKIF